MSLFPLNSEESGWPNWQDIANNRRSLFRIYEIISISSAIDILNNPSSHTQLQTTRVNQQYTKVKKPRENKTIALIW